MSQRYLERASYTWSEDSVRCINTPSKTARSTYLYVQEVGWFKTRPPYFTERENLDSYLLVYTLAGQGHLTYRGKEYTVSPGQAFWIYCGNLHRYEAKTGRRDAPAGSSIHRSLSDGSDPAGSSAADETGGPTEEWEILWVHFNGQMTKGYYDRFAERNVHVVSVEDRDAMECDLMRILSLTQKKEPHAELITSGLLVNVMTQLLLLSDAESLPAGRLPEYIRTALKYLENHFREPFDLDVLAQEAGVSKYHLSHQFHRYMGMPLNDYILTMRINFAKSLLRYTDQSVESVAAECGMPNVSYFIRQFKKAEEKTPLAYRKEWEDE